MSPTVQPNAADNFSPLHSLLSRKKLQMVVPAWVFLVFSGVILFPPTAPMLLPGLLSIFTAIALGLLTTWYVANSKDPGVSEAYGTVAFASMALAILLVGHVSNQLEPHLRQILALALFSSWISLLFVGFHIVASRRWFYSHLNWLKDKAYLDALTGVYNRAALEHFVQQSQGGYWLVMVDLNNLKLINDNLGHSAGDLVIQTVSQLLTRNIRTSTDMVFRLGGDEFVVLIKAASNQNAPMYLQALMGSQACCGTSYWWPDEAFEDALAAADEQMYLVKQIQNTRDKGRMVS